MDEVDIGLFDYDRHNTLYFFAMNADEEIYLRYGGRDPQSPDTYLSLESIELALKQGLELHQRRQRGEWKPSARPQPLFPRNLPLLTENTFAKNRCVECHLIGDYQNLQREQEGKLDKLLHMFRSPDLKTIGIHLDIPKGLVVKEARDAALAAGMKPGDRIAAINGTTVWTFGDLQYNYDQVERSAKSLALAVERDGAPVNLTLALPDRWWWTDIRFRQSSVDPKVYFESRPLTEAEKRQRGLNPAGFASEVKHVDMFAQVMKSHDLHAGDVVFAVDGAEADPIANTAELFIKLRKTSGADVQLGVLREGKRIQMPLKTFKMSFRK